MDDMTVARPGGSWYPNQGLRAGGREVTRGKTKGWQHLRVDGGGGSAEGPEQSSQEEAQDQGQVSSVLTDGTVWLLPRILLEWICLTGQSLGFRHWRQTTRSPLLISATSNLSTLPLQWPASLAPTSAESPASVCRAHRGPTRTGTASSAAHRAPAATGSAWLVPATYRNAEASVGPARRRGRGRDTVLPVSTEAPRAKAQSPAVLCEALRRIPSWPRPPAATHTECTADTQRPRDQECRTHAACSLGRTSQFTNP